MRATPSHYPFFPHFSRCVVLHVAYGGLCELFVCSPILWNVVHVICILDAKHCGQVGNYMLSIVAD